MILFWLIFFLDMLVLFISILFVSLLFAFCLKFTCFVLPEPLQFGIIEFLALSAGSFYLFWRYSVGSIPLTTSENKTTIRSGLIGGLLLAFISFPYAYIFHGGEIVESEAIKNDNVFFVLLFLLFSVVLCPIVEELLFRGCIFRVLKHRSNFFVATLISALSFALLHLVGSHVQFIRILLVSLILTFVYEYSGNIRSPIISHILGNGVWYSAVYLHEYNFI